MALPIAHNPLSAPNFFRSLSSPGFRLRLRRRIPSPGCISSVRSFPIFRKLSHRKTIRHCYHCDSSWHNGHSVTPFRERRSPRGPAIPLGPQAVPLPSPRRFRHRAPAARGTPAALPTAQIAPGRRPIGPCIGRHRTAVSIRAGHRRPGRMGGARPHPSAGPAAEHGPAVMETATVMDGTPPASRADAGDTEEGPGWAGRAAMRGWPSMRPVL